MPGGAEAALERVVLVEGLLERVQRRVRRGEALDRADARPSAWTASIRHERTGSPSSCTVHAPQTPCSQPTFVPVRPASWRMKSAEQRARLDVGRRTRAPLIVDRDPHASAVAAVHERGDERAAVRVASISAAASSPPPALAPRAARARRRARSGVGPVPSSAIAACPARADDGDAGGREVAVRARVLGERGARVRAAAAAPRSRSAARPAASAVVSGAGEELAAASARVPRCAERTWKRASSAVSATGSSAFGIGVRDGAADRPARADRGVPDVPDRLREQRPVRARRARERSSVAWRPSRRSAARRPLRRRTPSSRDPVDVDEPRRAREPQVEQRHQALAAGQHPRVLAEHGRPPPRPSRGATYSNGAGFTGGSAGPSRRGAAAAATPAPRRRARARPRAATSRGRGSTPRPGADHARRRRRDGSRAATGIGARAGRPAGAGGLEPAASRPAADGVARPAAVSAPRARTSVVARWPSASSAVLVDRRAAGAVARPARRAGAVGRAAPSPRRSPARSAGRAAASRRARRRRRPRRPRRPVPAYRRAAASPARARTAPAARARPRRPRSPARLTAAPARPSRP